MLMISACAWFLGGNRGTYSALPESFSTTLVYLLIALSVGRWLRASDYVVAGGLLITVGVSLVPLLTYSVEKDDGFVARGGSALTKISTHGYTGRG